MTIEEFDFPTVQKLLLSALTELSKEPCLFSFRINERTLTQRLALHLQLLVGRGLSVDCEYNRMWEEDDDIVKRLPWGAEPVRTDDDSGRTVYPDVIVHIRGKKFANFLVVEAKRNWRGKELPEIDRRKLEGFTDPNGDFRYRWGAFISFATAAKRKQAVVVWFAEGKQSDKHDAVEIQ